MNRTIAVRVSSVARAVAAAAGLTAAAADAALPAPQRVQARSTSYVLPVSYKLGTGLTVKNAQWVSGGTDGGHFAFTGIRRTFYVEATANIRSAVTYCPASQDLTIDKHGNGTRTCGPNAFLGRIAKHYVGFGTMTVDARGWIGSLVERYTP
ncbi:MAG: hypothetical protein ACR2F6_03080 [Mycobacteriales bacterium]